MNARWSSPALAWITRILSIGFVGLTAWGWWDESQARQEPMTSGAQQGDLLWQWAVVTHLLPLLLIVVALIVGWTRPAFGFLGFALYTALQVISVGTEWAYLPLVAAAPLVLTVLYLIGWLLGRRATRSTGRAPKRRT